MGITLFYFAALGFRSLWVNPSGLPQYYLKQEIAFEIVGETN